MDVKIVLRFVEIYSLLYIVSTDFEGLSEHWSMKA